jgi:hypothetical protein
MTVSISVQSPRKTAGKEADQAYSARLRNVVDPAYWAYAGGPNLRPTYTTGWGLLKQYPYAGRSFWNFNSAVEVTPIPANLPNVRTYGGTVGGLCGQTTLDMGADYGVKSLYGAVIKPNTAGTGAGNSFCDYGNAVDRARQLTGSGQTYGEGQAGIAYWATKGNAVHFDDPTSITDMPYYGGPFGSDIEAAFSVPNYGAMLRGLYSSDAAYVTAARTQDTTTQPPYHKEWRHHVLRWTQSYFLSQAAPLAASVFKTWNGAGGVPFSWFANGNLCIGSQFADSFLFEFDWRDVSGGVGSTFLDPENLADTTNLMTMYARTQLACNISRMWGMHAYIAPGSLSSRVPPNSSGHVWGGMTDTTHDDLPPTSSTYTEPAKLAAQYRSICAWIAANGCSPCLPVWVYDAIALWMDGWSGVNYNQFTGDPAQFVALFNFLGQNRALYDGFDTPASAALVIPDLDASYANGGTTVIANCWLTPHLPDVGSGSTWVLPRVKRYSRDITAPLMKAGIPWMACLVGDGLDRPRALSEYPLGLMDIVVKTENDSAYTDHGATAPTGTNVQDRSWAATADLTSYRRVVVSGATDSTRPVLTTLRQHADGRTAIHLINSNNVNYTTGALNSAQSSLTVRVRHDVFGAKRREAYWYEPGLVGGKRVRCDWDAGGVTVTLPALTDYGVVLFQ